MAYDIRLSTGYLDHHKILKLQQKHGFEAVLAHLRLLLYARENRADGVFCGMDIDDICLIIRNEITNVNERQNVIKTFLELHLLEKNSEGELVIHDWENHNQYSVNSTEKSEINRFCRLKAIAPDKYKELKDKGITKLTKDEYNEIQRTLTNVNESSNESLTPIPTQPNPTQNKNTDPITHGSKIPSLDEVREFFQMQGLSPSADAFFHHHEGTGWKIGKTPIQNWRSIALKWEQREGLYKQNKARGSLQSELQQIADTDLGGIANA